jgi:hypothetical protein
VSKPPTPIEERFWPKVEKTAGCWLWTGACTPQGYGRISVPGGTIYAHRYVASLVYGMLDRRWDVMHTCDTPNCVRPEHLRIGTRLDNMRDCADKGRASNQHKAVCAHGHAYDEENTRWYRGWRYCRACDKERSRARRAA